MTRPQRSASVAHDETRPGTPIPPRARRLTATRARPHKQGSRRAPPPLRPNSRMAPSEHPTQTQHHVARGTRRFRGRARAPAARSVSGRGHLGLYGRRAAAVLAGKGHAPVVAEALELMWARRVHRCPQRARTRTL